MHRPDQPTAPPTLQRAKAIRADPPKLPALRRFRAIGPRALLLPIATVGTVVSSIQGHFEHGILLVAAVVVQCLAIALWSWDAWRRTLSPQVHVHLARIDAWSRISDRRYLAYAVAAGVLAIAVFVQAIRVGPS